MWNFSKIGMPSSVAVVELDPLGELRRDRFDVTARLLVQRAIVDHDAAVLLGELLADEAQHEIGLLVEELGGLRLVGELGDLLPLRAQPAHVTLELFLCRALGGGAHDEAGVVRSDAVEDPPQALALVVRQALRDPVGLGLPRHHHEEAAGEAHFLCEASTLVRDRVLRDLHEDELPVLEHPLDLRLAPAFDVGLIERDVAAVEHTVLRRADVDERRLHAGQHVLHAPEVDVAVDRVGTLRRGQGVLDQAAPFEHGDVRVPALERVDAHQIAPGRAALAGAAAPALPRFVVELERGLVAQPEVGPHDVVGQRLGADGGTVARVGVLAVRARRAATAATTSAAATAPAAALRCGRLAVGCGCRRRDGRRTRVADPRARGRGTGFADPRRARGRRREAGFFTRDLGDVVVGQAAVGLGVEVALRLPTLVHDLPLAGCVAAPVVERVVVEIIGALCTRIGAVGRGHRRRSRTFAVAAAARAAPATTRCAVGARAGAVRCGTFSCARALHLSGAHGLLGGLGAGDRSLRNGVVGHCILLSSRVHLEGAREHVGFQRLQPRAVAFDPLCSAECAALGEDDAVG